MIKFIFRFLLRKAGTGRTLITIDRCPLDTAFAAQQEVIPEIPFSVLVVLQSRLQRQGKGQAEKVVECNPCSSNGDVPPSICSKAAGHLLLGSSEEFSEYRRGLLGNVAETGQPWCRVIHRGGERKIQARCGRGNRNGRVTLIIGI